VLTGGENVDLARGQVEQLQVRPAIGQIAVNILFKVKTIDDQGRDGLLLFFLLLRLARIGITHHEHNTL
jgi:hypothetical protein